MIKTIGPYSEYAVAQEKAIRLQSSGMGKSIRIDKKKGKWFITYFSTQQNPRALKHLSGRFYAISAVHARRLLGGKLPHVGSEKSVMIDGRTYWIARDPAGTRKFTIREDYAPGEWGSIVLGQKRIRAPLENPRGPVRIPTVRGDLLAVPGEGDRWTLYYNGVSIAQGTRAQISARAKTYIPARPGTTGATVDRINPASEGLESCQTRMLSRGRFRK